MVLFLAFSLQDQVEKYGAYVGLAAFLGLAVLSLLYFAQARELKRLRDWAGRAPERAQELEARVVAQAEEARRVPEPAAERSGTVGPAQPVAKPQPAVPVPAAGNGRQAGTPAPIPLGPRPAIAVAAAAARAAAAPQPVAVATQEPPAEAEVEASADGAAAPAPPTGDGPLVAPERPDEATPPPTPEPEPEPEPEAAGNGVPAEPVIPRATPRPQPRPAPAAAPLRSSTTRTTSPPPRRRTERGEGSSRAGRITALTLVGVVVLAAAAFGATQILGGDDAPPAPNPTVEPGGTPGAATPGAGNGQSAAARADTVVAILNGTPTEGLAKKLRDKLVAGGYSEQQGMIRTGNNLDQQRQDSVVLFAAGKRRQARDVERILGISGIEQMDADTQALADSTDSTSSGRPSDVAVIAGADQSP